MNRSRSILWTATSLLVSVGLAAAQGLPAQGSTPPPQRLAPRDRVTTSGTARIRGRVMAEESGGPVRYAGVRAMAAGTNVVVTATTDDNGGYEIVGLQAGSYALDVNKEGLSTG